MTAVRMPDLRARVPHRGTDRRSTDLRASDRGPHHLPGVTRTDGMAVSAAMLAVGAALAWWQPATGPLRTVGLTLVVLGPLALIATLTLLTPTTLLTRTTLLAGTPADELPSHLPTPTIDDRLPELALHHSVRPDRAVDPTTSVASGTHS